MTKETKFLKESIRVLDVKSWEEESKRLIQFEPMPKYGAYVFRHTYELQNWLENRGIAYQVNWVESQVHPLFDRMFNGFMPS